MVKWAFKFVNIWIIKSFTSLTRYACLTRSKYLQTIWMKILRMLC